jgi:MinD-like ATPase involved in chromosome partitioning or flagellar assembly
MMRVRQLRTWFDVKRVIARETNYGKNLPDSILKISIFSSGLEVYTQNQDQQSTASAAIKSWFGDRYQESEQAIQLDVDNAHLPIEFMLGDDGDRSSPSIRPFWHEVAYLKNTDESEGYSISLPEAYPENPEIIAFYSFKGGVGRTLHLASYVLALLERARAVNQEIKILVIDSDLEAPGLTYWQAYETQPITLSFPEFLELYQYPPTSLENIFPVVSQEIKKTARREGRSSLYFLPAFIEKEDLLDTPILPENIVRNLDGSWGVGDAIYRLGKTLGVDYIFVDLRAGLSEISSPLLFDSRVQRFLVTTLNEQSIQGISLVLEKIGCLAPSEEQIESDNYYDPTVIISFLTPELRQLPVFEQTLEQLQGAYIQPRNDSLNSTRLYIKETAFEQPILYLNNWEDAREKLKATSLMAVAREWAKSRLVSSQSSPTNLPETEVLEAVKRLQDTCERYIYAETGQGEDLLITEPLKNLAKNFQNSLPNVVSIGAKGAGKTFNYIQLSRLQSWDKFLEKVDSVSLGEDVDQNIFIFPVLQSKNLNENAKKIINDARQNVSEIIGDSSVSFSFSSFSDKITESLAKNDWSEVDWAKFWIETIGNLIARENPLSTLHEISEYLKQKEVKIIFLFDGLEDIFQNIATEEKQRKALRALIDNLPNQLSEIRDSYLGVVIFIRRDFLRYTITQNSQQFEHLYRAYDLLWDLPSFIRLSYWLCIQSHVIDANLEKLENLTVQALREELEKLWGKKLGTDKANEANSCNWIFAALTDFNGRLQARDIVRFLYYAAKKTIDNAKEVQFSRWSSSRLLPPQAIRRALQPCSEDKVQEAKEEYLVFKTWVEETLPSYNPNDKKIPFSPRLLEINSEMVQVLEQMGVIYEDKDKKSEERYYMPEIFREGLGFSIGGARPRVLALKRKTLGNL